MTLSALVFTGLLSSAHASSAVDNWPGTAPLRFEVIASAGGSPDIVLRKLSPYVSASIGVPVIVENRPGAGGNIAAAFVARVSSIPAIGSPAVWRPARALAVSETAAVTIGHS